MRYTSQVSKYEKNLEESKMSDRDRIEKVQIEKGNKSPNRIWKKVDVTWKKKPFLRPRCEIAVKNPTWYGTLRHSICMFADRFSTVIARNVDLLHNRFVDISWITGIIKSSPVHKHGPGFNEFPVTGYPGLGSILSIYQFTGHIMDANPAYCLNITYDQERIN